VDATFHQIEDEAIKKAQQFDLVDSQSGYIYCVLPDDPRSLPFGQYKPRTSHNVYVLSGSMDHTHPYSQLVPTFGANQYHQP